MNAWDKLAERIREIDNLGRARGVVGWDQRVMMPSRGAGVRASISATLAAIYHEKVTALDLGGLLDDVRGLDLTPEQTAILDRFAWERDRAVKLPARLAEDLARAASEGTDAWELARARDDYAAFAPHLSRMLELKREQAEAYGYEREPYDAHLETYERGLTAARVERMFGDLASRLRPLIDRALGAGLEEPSLPDGPYDPDAQLTYCRQLAARLGLGPDVARLDLSVHPFTSGIAPGDVRITTRLRPDDPIPAILATMHETGHGLYEAGLPEQWVGTPLSEPTSLSVHESQSRLWENHVGRSLEYWEGELPHAREALPPLRGIRATDLWRRMNTVQPSLIRVDADELTYPMHIVLRFEMERAISRGELGVDDLPAAWNEAMDRHLGVRPPSAATGVMQDTHWASGLLGYFPTYLLGSMYAAALFERATRDLGGEEPMRERLRTGELAPLLAWLREKLHVYGALRLGEETIAATGAETGPEPFLRYLERKVTDLVKSA